jgi:hypothetical protein
MAAFSARAARAQSAPSGRTARLPDAIRLVLRGKVGDAYVISSSSNGGLEMVATLPDNTVKKTGFDEKENQVETKHVRAIDAQGNVKIETRTVSGQKTKVEEGASKTTPSELKAYVETFAPSFKRLSRVKLATTPPKAATKGKKRAGAASKSKREDDTLENPPFPDKVLHVGDTWQGTLPMRFASLENQELAYTAKLAAVEFRQSLPCAKVEYVISMHIDQLPKEALDRFPSNARINGDYTIEGTLTDYYRLDRGTAVESVGSIQLTLQYEIKVPNPNGGDDLPFALEGNGEYGVKDMTTKGPAYDASLVTPVSETAAPSP